MFNHIHIIFSAMAIWMLPRISAMISRNEDPNRLYKYVRGGLLTIVTVSLLLFYIVSPYIFPVWIGHETYIYMQGYIKAFVCFEIIFAHTILPVIYLNASGKERLATQLTFMYCGMCYICMMLGLWYFKNPVALVEGMVLAMCITMPIINIITQKSMSSAISVSHILMEMVAAYSAILLLYTNNHIAIAGLSIITITLLWKFYLADLFNRFVWKPVKA
jgi:hypothetical protein